ncbi:MAG: PLP-dependent aminotransferase family protein [Ruminococcus flavefaciens]|nr:PLP-dependent aminotransferase family protein [Ruminococcus flavefaciens]MCM1360275.1 PLP-dependent aminotransferase family protein [Clostridiales bacterium]MCM1435342.1 PLP-dependent aminotransferase family protein [Ruminococcus flavefaciens]
MDYKFSDKVSGLKASAIREILKYTSDPEVISFAAGNPAPEAFPKEAIAEISAELLKNDPVLALQYSITEGYTPLRDYLKNWMSEKNCFHPEFDDLIITSGGQQANELSCKVLLNEGDTLLCESPSFIGSLNAFRSYNVNLKGIDMDEDGINIEKLENALKTEPNVKILYLIPNFQNPTGRTMSLAKRKAVYELACKYDFIILEDDPYGELRFAGETIPSIKSLDAKGRVIYSSTFSKLISPGFRTGYVSAPAAIIQKIVVCKQVSDVHSNIWAQVVSHRFMSSVNREEHFNKLRAIYKEKCELMCSLIESGFSKKITYTKPEGGLFIWCTLPEGCDMNAFCTKAVKDYKIAVVPGNSFSIDENEVSRSFRLNYSTPTNEQIKKGMDILAKMTREMLD